MMKYYLVQWQNNFICKKNWMAFITVEYRSELNSVLLITRALYLDIVNIVGIIVIPVIHVSNITNDN